LANHPSALKRIRQTEKRRLRNKLYRTRMKTLVKRVKEAIQEKNVEEAAARLQQASQIISKTATKGVIHKRTAARKVSRLTRQVNALRAS
jgi:small subunit ribosomal protein S20